MCFHFLLTFHKCLAKNHCYFVFLILLCSLGMLYVQHHRLQVPLVFKGRGSNVPLEIAGFCFLAFWKYGVSIALMPLVRNFFLPSPQPTSQVLISSSITLKPKVKRDLWSQRTDFTNDFDTTNSQIKKRRESGTFIKTQETNPKKTSINDEILFYFEIRFWSGTEIVGWYNILSYMSLGMNQSI